jgi:ribonuclease T1
VIIQIMKNWLFFLAALLFSLNISAKEPVFLSLISVAQLPDEALQTLRLIRQGGPFPYAKDGTVFGNYEKALPQQKRGYYHEFTVPTPTAHNRGAQRIIVGGDIQISREYYYTNDHYATFRRITK